MKKENDWEYALWMCNYWAKKCFARDENSEAGWLYLLMAEQVKDAMAKDKLTGAHTPNETDKLTGGQHVQG